MTIRNNHKPPPSYSTAKIILYWILSLLGVLISGGVTIAISQIWIMVVWNVLMLASQGYILSQLSRAQDDSSLAKRALWQVLMMIGVLVTVLVSVVVIWVLEDIGGGIY
jgi:uncharacterized membrane protein